MQNQANQCFYRPPKNKITCNLDQFVAPVPPLDQQGYTRSFTLEALQNQQAEVGKFYQEYGFVVVNGILTNEQIQKTIDDLWRDVEHTYNKVQRNNPQSWQHIYGLQKKFGFVNHQPLEELQIWENRKNKNVYYAFKSLYQITSSKPLNQPLIACFDRGSMLRPTVGHPQWKSNPIYHFDIDPWSWVFDKEYKRRQQFKEYSGHLYHLLMGEGNYQPYMGYTKLAGVIALSNTNPNSGGFQCVTGFQNYIQKWCMQRKRNEYGKIQNCPQLIKNFHRIYFRKGSMLIFSRELPHNIYPNESDQFRYAQYMRMTPESTLCLDKDQKQKRQKLVADHIPKGLNVDDPISKEIFMLQ